MQSFWLKYKSGTDIRFTAVDTKESKADMTAQTVTAIINAYAVWLGRTRGRNNLKIAVGHDPRISAKWIKEAVIAALASSGCDILDCGLSTTPCMFHMTKFSESDADGSVMITASHHPFDKNGLKFFTPDGGLEGKDIEEILELAARGTAKKGNGGVYVRKDFMKLYTDALLGHIREETGVKNPLSGFKIVVDAGNGAGGFFASKILQPLGADTSGSQFLEPDGMFPNHVPNPENAAAMKAISDCVKSSGADLGIIFDTDVDRAALVDSSGKEINRNRLIALLSAIVLEEYPGATVVTDSVTSDGLKKFIAACGGVHHRFRRGYKNVIDEAIRLTKEGIVAPLAIETSGHAALAENYYLDDGAYLVVKVLIKICQLKKEGKSLAGIIEGLPEPLEEEEIRLTYVRGIDNWRQAGENSLRTLEERCRKTAGCTVAEDSFEGVRVNTADGFFLVRQSVHDPVIPVNFEATTQGGCMRMRRLLKALLDGDKHIDCSKLEERGLC